LASPRSLPLFRRFPQLARLPRVTLGHPFTPVVGLPALSPNLWIKRDDAFGNPIGGNKVRALEFLFGDLKKGDDVVTVGSVGSTHALAVATYGRKLGARVLVARWRQEMNPAAERVGDRLQRVADQAPVFRSPVAAYAWAWTHRARGAKWIAAGGSNALGILGHVNAGLELVEQIDRGDAPEPRYVVVPLGTGGTAAGLALAFAIAERDITVVGARVVPWIVARRGRVKHLARATARLIEQHSQTEVPTIRADRFEIAEDTYGGAYGRETDAGRAAAERLRTVSQVGLDATYSAKAFAHALDRALHGPTLFWLTFDSRILGTT
jgi:D-cysteine desulfhydrase